MHGFFTVAVAGKACNFGVDTAVNAALATFSAALALKSGHYKNVIVMHFLIVAQLPGLGRVTISCCSMVTSTKLG